jgi:hypothetical protein
MRILVCGGRDYSNRSRIHEVLSEFDPLHTTLIEGGAKGADELAYEFARLRQFDARTYFAKWNHYDKAAGHIRNEHMLMDSNPDIVIAFPGGRGTADMVRRAYKAGVPVREVE